MHCKTNQYIFHNMNIRCFFVFSFSYEHESGKVEAIQETRFTSFPPVLHVQLRRFKYDPLTKTMSKINKRFEFYPKLDLRIYRPDAMYTLHSVLGKCLHQISSINHTKCIDTLTTAHVLFIQQFIRAK